MHISEGVVSPSVLVGGAILAASGIAIGLKTIKDKDIPKVAVLSSAFFVASLIHVPVGPVSAHLVLNGLLGLLLGWASFPSLSIALLLQAIIFQYGGLTTLGTNTFILAMPSVIVHYCFRGFLGNGIKRVFIAGCLSGILAIFLSILFVSFALILTTKAFFGVVVSLVSTHLPLALIEGLISGFILVYLKKVKPEVLGWKRV
ncbi:MAG: cobalt transporter CbiM [Desulfobacterota bacterium]|nr:cobalt transporter CbiM [Thermodesulfobacteriota bacterium]MDW8001451.1 cobalt transporter CbiM [Deltaproteobacteria bacterium]